MMTNDLSSHGKTPLGGAKWLIGAGVAAVALVAVSLGGLDRFFGPSRPEVYTLTVIAGEDGALSVTGHAPDDGAVTLLERAAREAAGGGAVALAVEQAPRPPSEEWIDAVVSMIGALSPLDDWVLSVAETNATARGEAATPEAAAAVERRLRAIVDSAGLALNASVSSPAPPADPVDLLRTALTPLEDCGPLWIDRTPVGQTVAVVGRFGTPEAVRRAKDAAYAALGDAWPRANVQFNLQPLNPAICQFRRLLGEGSGVRMLYSDGATGAAQPNGVFNITSNPVIDAQLEAAVEGHLQVIVVTPKREVYALYPWTSGDETQLATLRRLGGGETVRITYPNRPEFAQRMRLAPQDFGHNLVVAFIAEHPVLPVGVAAVGDAGALYDQIYSLLENLLRRRPDMARTHSVMRIERASDAE